MRSCPSLLLKTSTGFESGNAPRWGRLLFPLPTAPWVTPFSARLENARVPMFAGVRFDTFPLVLLTLLAGCASRQALLDLPAEHRQHIRFVPTDQQPRVRYASAAARTAREFGGVIGLAISGSIEHSTNAFGEAGAVIGRFEAEALQAAFADKLRSSSLEIASAHPEASVLELRVHAVGLREVERERFSPFVDASARLTGHRGREIWSARAQSTSVHAVPLQSFRENPNLYREDFHEVALDLVKQLVEGPLRSLNP